MFEMSFKSISESEKHMQNFVNIYLAYILKHVTAAFSELCRFPLLLSIITGCINFWLHMMQSDNKALISKAYLEQYNIVHQIKVTGYNLLKTYCMISEFHMFGTIKAHLTLCQSTTTPASLYE